jgi:hypothetical protein
MIGGLPSIRENGVSMWTLPSLRNERSSIWIWIDSQSLDQSRPPLLGPNGLLLDLVGVVELSSSLALLTDNDDADATALDGTRGEEADTAVASGAKVDRVGSRLGEVTRLDPVNGVSEDLVAKGGGERSGERSEVSA